LLIDTVVLVLFYLAFAVAAITFGRSALGWTAVAASFLVTPAYFTVQHGRTGQTIGKAQAGIKVADQRTGGSIGYLRAFARWLTSFLMVVFFYIPYLIDVLWPLWDRGNQALHDKAVRSHVVKAF
jgi:uncharacterized RDD family membrane protein YckC